MSELAFDGFDEKKEGSAWVEIRRKGGRQQVRRDDEGKEKIKRIVGHPSFQFGPNILTLFSRKQ